MKPTKYVPPPLLRALSETPDPPPKRSHAPVFPSGVFERDKLPVSVRHNYRAAGVLPYVVRAANRADGTRERSIVFLLGKQPTKSQDRRWRQRWVEFGGKVESSDDGPEGTALRELREETSACLGTVRLHPMCVWNSMCKFVLYLGEIVDELPSTMPTGNDEISEYRFVERDQMMYSVRVGRLFDAEISYRTRSSLNSTKAWQLLRSL